MNLDTSINGGDEAWTSGPSDNLGQGVALVAVSSAVAGAIERHLERLLENSRLLDLGSGAYAALVRLISKHEGD